MSIIGNRETFAIEYEVLTKQSEIAFGHFAWWSRGLRIGDWNEVCNLKDVVSWCNIFYEDGIDRNDVRLEALTKEEVFAAIYDREMVYTLTNKRSKLRVPSPVSRFHITHIGMSSFDNFAVLLIQYSDVERLLWADLRTKSLRESILPLNTIKQQTYNFIKDFE